MMAKINPAKEESTNWAKPVSRNQLIPVKATAVRAPVEIQREISITTGNAGYTENVTSFLFLFFKFFFRLFYSFTRFIFLLYAGTFEPLVGPSLGTFADLPIP